MQSCFIIFILTSLLYEVYFISIRYVWEKICKTTTAFFLNSDKIFPEKMKIIIPRIRISLQFYINF